MKNTMNSKNIKIYIYTLLHFLVDLTTVLLVTQVLLGPDIGMVNRGAVIIVYNLLAFAGQLPIGMIADIINKNPIIAMIGCLLAGIAYPIAYISPWTACVLVSLGNGAFHIGAGADVLKMSMPKTGFAGLFVSSGAFGVWLAYLLNNRLIIVICPALMIIAAVLMYLFYKRDERTELNINISYKFPKASIFIAVSCFMLTIVIRSLLGMVMSFSWKTVPILSFLSVAAVAGGKALGGFINDKYGSLKTVIISLLISVIGFVFSFDYWVLGIIAILCFNMTMPLTLTAISSLCDKKYGFAFGLTTFALAIGFIPVVFGAKELFGIPLLAIGGTISLILLVLGYKLINIKT